MPFVSINHIRLHYQLHGEHGPLVTVIGGLGDNIRNWSMLAVPLSRRVRLLLIDNRGAGLSDKPPGPYTIAEMSADVIGLLDQLGEKTTSLIGFSMGAKIAMAMALHHPDRIEKLILIAPTPASEKAGHAFSDEVREVLENHEPTAEHFRRQFQILFSPRYKSKFSADMFVKFKLADPHPQPKEAFFAQLAAVKDFDLTDAVHHIVCPTLIIAGKQDRLTAYQNAEWLAANIPHAEIKLYDEAGHIPQAEETRRFLDDTLAFLGSGD